MKRILIFAVVLSLLVPAAAFAATEFSLGGYIKLDSFWDSTNNSMLINGAVLRNNDPSFHHGNLRFTAEGSRFNFTIKGPDVLGAKLTGFIEMDFESSTDQAASASQSYVPRLRHAMFRLNWPGDSELLFGQYWSMFCDYFAEVAEDGPFMFTGTPTARLPQIRFTQGFLGDWHVSALVGQPNNGAGIFATSPYNTTVTNGSSAETPQIQGQIKYSHDWWGKAANYGHPMPFTASITAGWQRNVARPNEMSEGEFADTIGLNGTAVEGAQYAHTYVSPWLVMGSFFIPVIPTHSDNLANTAHLLLQPWIGQGVNAFGFTGDSVNIFKFKTNAFNSDDNGYIPVDVQLLQRFGLLAEAQYYFTNQWYLNVAYGVSAAMNTNQSLVTPFRLPQYSYVPTAALAQVRRMDQVDATLWWRPIAALKFGMQYSYAHCQFLSDSFPNSTTSAGFPVSGSTAGSLTNKGDEHRVEFVGFFYF